MSSTTTTQNILIDSTLRAIDKILPAISAHKPDFTCADCEVSSLRGMMREPCGSAQKAIRSLLDMVYFSLTEFRLAIEQYGDATEGYPAFVLNSARQRLETSIKALKERVMAL